MSCVGCPIPAALHRVLIYLIVSLRSQPEVQLQIYRDISPDQTGSECGVTGIIPTPSASELFVLIKGYY